ncbi:MAG TPA: hypothetical protein VKZ96_17525 [Thermomicrobiales bacterium]|nr:hypothetical protein [Thermomicrobiales bacterium]
MAKYPAHEPVYEVARLFRQRCLTEGASLLWPERRVWTSSNIDTLLDAFMEHPDTSKGTFIDKWERQLADKPDDVHRLAADALAFYYLFPSNIGGQTKVARVRAVLSWRFADNLPDLSSLERAYHAGGIGHAGLHYGTAQPHQIAYYLTLGRRITDSQIDAGNVDQFRHVADAVRQDVPQSAGARNIAMHLLFPERFERIASDGHKHRIVSAFADRSEGERDVDDALLSIRRSFEQEYGPTFDFYDVEEVRNLWQPTGSCLLRLRSRARSTTR